MLIKDLSWTGGGKYRNQKLQQLCIYRPNHIARSSIFAKTLLLSLGMNGMQLSSQPKANATKNLQILSRATTQNNYFQPDKTTNGAMVFHPLLGRPISALQK